MHILLTNVHFDCRGEGSSNRNASRDESVETGDESVETGDKSIEAGEKTPQSCYNSGQIVLFGIRIMCDTPIQPLSNIPLPPTGHWWMDAFDSTLGHVKHIKLWKSSLGA